MPQFIDQNDNAILWLDAVPVEPTRNIFDQKYVDPEWIKLTRSKDFFIDVPEFLRDEGPKFTDKEYRTELERYLKSIDLAARQVLKKYGITETDYLFGQIPLKLNKKNEVPAVVYAAARIVELLEMTPIGKRESFRVSDLHTIGKVVELVRVQELELLEQDLERYAVAQRKLERQQDWGRQLADDAHKVRDHRRQPVWDGILKTAKRLKKKNPSLSERALARLIEEELGEPAESIRRILRRNR